MRIGYRELRATDWLWMAIAAGILLGCPDGSGGDGTPTATPTIGESPTPTASPTLGESPTPTASPTRGESPTPTASPTFTVTPTATGTGPGQYYEFTLSSFSFNHTVGETSCPQAIGTMRVDNFTDTTASVETTKAAGVTSFIVISPSVTTAPAGGNATLNVSFNCGTTSNFSGDIGISANNGSLSDSDSGTVVSNITSPPS